MKKVELAKGKLGGVMIWELGCDAAGDLSRLRALDQTIKAGECRVRTFFKDEDGDGFGDLRKPIQAFKMPAGYVPDSRDTNDSDPAARP